MVIGGHPLGINNGTVLSIDMNSPDMSADGWVGLTEVGRFANALDDGCP